MRLFLIFIAFYGTYASAKSLDTARCTEPGVYEEFARGTSREKIDSYSITGDFRNGEGFLTYNNIQGERGLVRSGFCDAFYICKRLGGRLPTVTELAQQAQQYGARIINFEKIIKSMGILSREEVEGVHGFVTIDAEDENQKKREVFAYSREGFDNSYSSIRKKAFPDDRGGDHVWSSSTAHFYYTNAHDYYNDAFVQAYAMSEDGYLTPILKGDRNIVKCVLN